MRSLFLVATASALAACSTTLGPSTRSAEAQAELNRLIAGRVAGQPVKCLPSYRTTRMTTIDGATVAFETGGRVYVSHLSPGCERLGGPYALVTSNPVGNLCSGDIAHVSYPASYPATGTTLGSCVIGEFVPYSRPGA